MTGSNLPRVAIADYGMGNLFSVSRACEQAGLDGVITDDPRTVDEADAVILPGVGAYGDAMATLDSSGVAAALHRAIDAGKPFLGVCLGIQLLMSASQEFGTHGGMNIIAGDVRPFVADVDADPPVKVPQLQWNRVHRTGGEAAWQDTPLAPLNDGGFMYFVHSYYVVPDDPAVVIATTTYGDVTFCSALRKENVFACQFHPERSGAAGLRIYQSFAEQILRRNPT